MNKLQKIAHVVKRNDAINRTEKYLKSAALNKKSNITPYVVQAGAGAFLGGGIGALGAAVAGDKKDSQGNVIQSRGDRVKSWLARGAGIGAGAGLVGGKMLRDTIGSQIDVDPIYELQARRDLGLPMPESASLLSPFATGVEKGLQNARPADPAGVFAMKNIVGIPKTLEGPSPTYEDAANGPSMQRARNQVSDEFLQRLGLK